MMMMELLCVWPIDFDRMVVHCQFVNYYYHRRLILVHDQHDDMVVVNGMMVVQYLLTMKENLVVMRLEITQEKKNTKKTKNISHTIMLFIKAAAYLAQL